MEYDARLYGESHLVECFIDNVKRYWRICTRFKKLSRRYLGFWRFAAALHLARLICQYALWRMTTY